MLLEAELILEKLGFADLIPNFESGILTHEMARDADYLGKRVTAGCDRRLLLHECRRDSSAPFRTGKARHSLVFTGFFQVSR